MTKPNILFINVDQMRADCLSILGHPVVETPYLDHLAQHGALFNNAYSATPTCIPARAAILTGMSQRSHGRIGYKDKIPWNYEHTMPGELAAAGYHTQCVGKMHVYPQRKLCGFHNVVLHDGFMHYTRFKHLTNTLESFDYADDYINWLRDKAGAHHDMIDLGLDVNSAVMARPWHLPEEYHPTNWVVTESIDFLRRRDPTRPFFLKMSFVNPHPPFYPPKDFYDQYLNEEIPEPVIGDWVEFQDQERRGLKPVPDKGVVSPKRLRRARAAYYALIAHIDNQIGRFLLAMDEYGVSQNTIILFASDHGELLGDHHRFRKFLPYEGSAGVPFILSDPGNCLQLKKRITLDEVVELRDIMPTLLDAADVSIPDSVEGQSVLPLARGEDSQWREYLHGEHTWGEDSTHYITNGMEKYIWFSQTGEEQLFNLDGDPEERRNLAGDSQYEDRISYWRQKLVEELTGREEGYTDGEKLIVGRKPQKCLSHILPESAH